MHDNLMQEQHNENEIDFSNLETCKNVLVSDNYSVNDKYSAIFGCRNFSDTSKAVEVLKDALNLKSVLVAHEAAYALGQMQDSCAINYLIDCLNDKSKNSIVRHEAAEALGAINNPSENVIKALKSQLLDAPTEVSETCELALSRIKFFQSNNIPATSDKFLSVDPAPPSKSTDYIKLSEIMLDGSYKLFKRYQAIFTFRNICTDYAVECLSEGLNNAECSPLMRHELCYVLGEMKLESAIEPLYNVLNNESQHPMVRHEAAESLGAIGTKKCKEILVKFIADPVEVVRESIAIALNSNEFL